MNQVFYDLLYQDTTNIYSAYPSDNLYLETMRLKDSGCNHPLSWADKILNKNYLSTIKRPFQGKHYCKSSKTHKIFGAITFLQNLN